LASLGNAHYSHRLEDKVAASSTLKEVNWVVSERWNGIGGKVTVTEDGVAKMSAASGKESITRAVQAITKPDTKAGKEVRGLAG
jgi:O-acetylhomoserine/O-acetylserine sulfhydrylase-like pyridoxal-dependent enzyme